MNALKAPVVIATSLLVAACANRGPTVAEVCGAYGYGSPECGHARWQYQMAVQASQNLMQYGAQMQQQYGQPQMQPMETMTCRPLGNTVQCTNW